MNDAPRFTRRSVLGGAAAAGAGALIAPGAALARGSTGARVFSQAVGATAGVSPVIAAPRRVVLAGLQWSEPVAAAIELRARAREGRWSPWAPASVRGHDPDRPAAGDAQQGEPLWFGPVDEVQLRSVGVVHGVVLHFVAAAAVAGASSGNAATVATALPLARPLLPAGGGQPPIIARSAWAGRDHGPTAGPYYGSIELAFVHHTVNPNGYAASEVPAMLLAIYDYHRYTRGYFDIAYNFIIDAFGRIWEARAGGIDEPVIGAHAGGYNSISTGVALLGTFSNVGPTPASVAALRRLLAWKLPLHGVPALGKVGIVVAAAGAAYTPFRPGAHVRLPRIAGHRDGDITDCPGNDLYVRLPGIRTEVNALAGVPVALSLHASATTVPPAVPVTLSGRLRRLHGAPIPGAPLQIQTVAGMGRTTTIAAVVTAADGTWAATVTPPQSVVVRAVHSAAPAAVSNLAAIGVTPAITLTLAATSPLTVAGTVAPAKRSVTIVVYQEIGGRRKPVLTRKVTVRHGSFTARLSLGAKAAGDYVIVAQTAADAISAAGMSAPVTVTV